MFFHPFLRGVKISGDVIREGTLIIVKRKKEKKQFQHNTAKESLGWKLRCKMETFAGVVSSLLREAGQQLTGLPAAPVRVIR